MAIPFFDKRLSRKIVRLGDAEVVNRLFPATDANIDLSPDVLFDSEIGVGVDPEDVLRRLGEMTSGVSDPGEKVEIVLKDLEARSKAPLPEIDRIPTHYAEDGLDGLTLALRLRQIVAAQHWLGNLEYTLGDAIQAVLRMPFERGAGFRGRRGDRRG